MRSRRALSSVVGTVFAIIALSTTVGYITYSMNVLDKYNQSILTTNANAVDRSKEQLQITRVTIDNNRFNITAIDTGNIPIHLTRLWVTNTTDPGKVFRYNINYNLTSSTPQLKIGQSTPLVAKTNQAYDLKLITERGNVKEFTVNSPGTAPLNIQLFALPASVVSGFKTELVMIVTNNGSSILTNVSPNILPSSNGTALCAAGTVSPSSYNSLAPGGTAIFKWDVTATSGGLGSQACSYVLTQPLQNGYSQTVKATITVSPIQFSSTNLSANTGVMTINYTSFRWEQGNGWKKGWAFPAAPGNQPNNQQNTGFSMNVTNNNSTMDFYIDNHTQSYFSNTNTGSNLQLFIVNKTDAFNNTLVPYTCPSKPSNYCVVIPAGKTVPLYFGVKTLQGSDMTNLGTANTYMMQLLLYGKFAPSKNVAGTEYAQDIPFIAILAT